MRAFVAIPVSDSVKQYARMIRNELGKARPDVKWVEYENYHLTIKFLGSVKPNNAPDLKKALAMAAQAVPPFSLSAGGVGFFPSKSKPRVIWVGIKGEIEKAIFLGERVDTYLAEIGYEQEKSHRFHLTLGRVRSDSGINEMLKLVQGIVPKDKLISFSINEFYLMKSDLTPEGPKYSIVEKYRLDG